MGGASKHKGKMAIRFTLGMMLIANSSALSIRSNTPKIKNTHVSQET
jgi:hypothetical protein